MSDHYFVFASSDQTIIIEQDPTSKETTVRFQPCEKVVDTIHVNKQEFETSLFNAIKDMYFKHPSV